MLSSPCLLSHSSAWSFQTSAQNFFLLFLQLLKKNDDDDDDDDDDVDVDDADDDDDDDDDDSLEDFNSDKQETVQYLNPILSCCQFEIN